jgi:hypothetical protein
VEEGCVIAYPLGIGMMIAVAVSWEAQHSVLWSTIDGCLGWLYLIYHFWLSGLLFGQA